jgi:hypothetical protein
MQATRRLYCFGEERGMEITNVRSATRTRYRELINDARSPASWKRLTGPRLHPDLVWSLGQARVML